MLDNHILQSAKPVKLMERSIFSARYCFVENMFRSGRILGCEYEVLDEWFKFATSPDNGLNLNVDLIIYLKTSPQKVKTDWLTVSCIILFLQALERINVRARSEENQIPLDYLEQLHSLHEDWLIQGKYPVPAPVLVIDADKVKSIFRKLHFHSLYILYMVRTILINLQFLNRIWLRCKMFTRNTKVTCLDTRSPRRTSSPPSSCWHPRVWLLHPFRHLVEILLPFPSFNL